MEDPIKRIKQIRDTSGNSGVMEYLNNLINNKKTEESDNDSTK